MRRRGELQARRSFGEPRLIPLTRVVPLRHRHQNRSAAAVVNNGLLRRGAPLSFAGMTSDLTGRNFTAFHTTNSQMTLLRAYH
jgi:hypothetical protein